MKPGDDALLSREEGRAPEPAPKASRAAALPWVIAAVGLLGAVAVLASRNSSTSPKSAVTAPFTDSGSTRIGNGGTPPDIGALSPSERASRLYVRVMEYAEAGLIDSVAMFAPMVLAAHQMLVQPTVDERYHFGRVAEVTGTGAITQAQADTILSSSPRSLLGLLLAARAARLKEGGATAAAFNQRLLAALDSELATRNPDYDNHRAEIDQAVADARRPN